MLIFVYHIVFRKEMTDLYFMHFKLIDFDQFNCFILTLCLDELQLLLMVSCYRTFRCASRRFWCPTIWCFCDRWQSRLGHLCWWSALACQRQPTGHWWSCNRLFDSSSGIDRASDADYSCARTSSPSSGCPRIRSSRSTWICSGACAGCDCKLPCFLDLSKLVAKNSPICSQSEGRVVRACYKIIAGIQACVLELSRSAHSYSCQVPELMSMTRHTWD